jgi:ABC-2 type transport system ATP-binding protein
MIQVSNLCKTYGNKTVLDNISFQVKKGEILGLLGPNGAGKSTLIKIIACYIPSSSGSVEVCGFDVKMDSLEVRNRIGYLPEKVQLYRDLTVEKFLEFSARIKDVSSDDYRENINKVMSSCGISHVAGKHIRKLSKGYCQRVGIAQALLGDPQILIFDEPTVGLDPKQIVDIRRIIKEQSGKKTVIISTHILHEASMLCDTVMIMANGRITVKNTQQKLYASLQGEPQMRIRIQGPIQEVQSDISSLGYKISAVNDVSESDQIWDYIFQVPDHIESKGNLARFISARWELLEMSVFKISLEDIFMDMIGENYEEVS